MSDDTTPEYPWASQILSRKIAEKFDTPPAPMVQVLPAETVDKLREAFDAWVKTGKEDDVVTWGERTCDLLDAADTPRDECHECKHPKSDHHWVKGGDRWACRGDCSCNIGYDRVAPAAPDCGHGYEHPAKCPTCKSEAVHDNAAAMAEICQRPGCGHQKVSHCRSDYGHVVGRCLTITPCTCPAFVAAPARVPVNDEAEALRAERDAYRDQSDEDQKARGRLVMELDILSELASAYLAAWGGGIPKLWLDAFTALGIEAMDDIQAAFDLAQSLAARGENA